MLFSRSFLTTALLAASISSYANIPIESRTLTPNVPNTANRQASDPTVDQTSTLWKLYQQVQRLEEDMRLLRGRFESQEQQLSQTDKELKTRFTDLDQRFEQLHNQIQTPIAAETPSTPPTNTTTIPTDSNLATTPATANPPPPTVTTDDADKRAYVGAYDAYRAGGAGKAIAPMKTFIQNYPNSVYVPNANYWLGEFYLASTPPDFVNAKRSFTIVMQQYPKSAKAAAAIYRLATMAEVDDQLIEATRLMKLLTQQYPNTQEAGYAATFLKSHNAKSSSNTKPTDKSTKPTNTPSTTPRKPSAVINTVKPRIPAV
jgi:tol-pal system protein YbgF